MHLDDLLNEDGKVLHEMKLQNRFFSMVLDGTKTQTVRKGAREYNPGDKLKMVGDDGNASVEVRITGVEIKMYRDLTHIDALMDGFVKFEELTDVLTEIYGELGDDQLMTIIKFEVA